MALAAFRFRAVLTQSPYACVSVRLFANKLHIRRPPKGEVGPLTGLALAKQLAHAKFDEACELATVEMALQLNIDPRKPGQNVRTMVSLPNGTGKKISVAVFARGAKAEEARQAGAAVVGAEDLVQQINEGNLNFTRCIATPDMMPLVGRVARILGPRGLMPNPKLGTITMDVANAVKEARRGQVELRVEKMGILHAPLGKVSFDAAALKENMQAVLEAVSASKPEAVKGKFIMGCVLTTTMGKGCVRLDATTVDPTSTRYLSEPVQPPEATADGAHQ